MSNEWDAESAVCKVLGKQAPTIAPASYIGQYTQYNSDKELTAEIIEDALIKAARLTAELGIDTRLFDRLEDELKRKQSHQTSMDRIAAYASRSLESDSISAYA